MPVFSTPEHAARALGHAARHAARRRHPPPAAEPPTDVDPDGAAAVIARALAAGPGWLGAEDTEQLLRAYGLPLAPARVAASPHAAGRCAAALGGEVALKAIVPGLLHKRDADAVRLGLHGAGRARAARELRSALEAEGRRSTVSSSRRWRRPASRCWSASSPTRGSARRGLRRGRDGRRAAGRRPVRLAPVAAAEAAEMIRGAAHLPAARRLPRRAAAPISGRSRMWSCASARSPPRTPRSPSSTFNPVIASPTRRGGRRRAGADRAPGPPPAVPGDRPLTGPGYSASSPARRCSAMTSGVGGQPGDADVDGQHLLQRARRARPRSPRTPQPSAQSPSAATSRGSGIAS